MRGLRDMDEEDSYWRRNLAVCLLGSFTTIVAMTLLLPFLPIYVEQLGVSNRAAIAQWSGVAYGATFFAAALVAPLWGQLADRYGRKLMLIRASLGMAVAMSLIGMVHNVWELVALRLFAGFAGGYASGSTILVATQTPKARSGWALGMLTSGIMAGNLVGPLIGGALPPLIGIRGTFWLAGGVIFLTFIATTVFIREDKRPAQIKKATAQAGWSQIPDKRPVVAMLGMGLLLMLANMSIEPIITIYVGQLVDASRVTIVSGIVMSAAALGSILSASRLGRLADRIGFAASVRLAYAIEAACIALLSVTANGVVLALTSVVVGAYVPGITTLTLGRARELLPGGIDRQRAAWSVATAAFALGQAVAAYGFSYLFVLEGSYTLLFALGAAAIVTALVIDVAAA